MLRHVHSATFTFICMLRLCLVSSTNYHWFPHSLAVLFVHLPYSIRVPALCHRLLRELTTSSAPVSSVVCVLSAGGPRPARQCCDS